MANTVPLGIQASVSGAQAVVADIDRMSMAANRMARLRPSDVPNKGLADLKRNLGSVRAGFGALGATMNTAGGQAGALVNQIASGFVTGGPVIGAITAATSAMTFMVTAYEKQTERALQQTIRLATEEKKVREQLLEARGIPVTAQERIQRDVDRAAGSQSQMQSLLSRYETQVKVAQRLADLNIKDATKTTARGGAGDLGAAGQFRQRALQFAQEEAALRKGIEMLRQALERNTAATERASGGQPQGVVIEEVSLP